MKINLLMFAAAMWLLSAYEHGAAGVWALCTSFGLGAAMVLMMLFDKKCLPVGQEDNAKTKWFSKLHTLNL